MKHFWMVAKATGWQPPSADRQTRREFVALPLNWRERLAGWWAGAIYRLDWPLAGEGLGIPTTEGCEPAPDQWAVLAPAMAGGGWLFTHRAVWAAFDAWRGYRIQRVVGAPLWIRWLSDLPGFPGTQVLAPVPAIWPGTYSVGDLDQAWVFHPAVIGPLGTMDGGQLRWAQDLAGRTESGRLWCRGTRVAGGFWDRGRIQMVRGEGGWLELTQGQGGLS